MAPKTNTQSPQKTKASKSQKDSVKQDSLVNKKKSDDSNDIVFDPSNICHVALFWDDLYRLYLDYLSIQDEEFYKTVKEAEEALKLVPGLTEILLIFKKIVPTIQLNDYEPFRFLGQAILDVRNFKNCNNLCIFMRIATTRFNELEAFVNNKKNESDKGLGGNSFSTESTNKEKREEAELLLPLFENIILNKLDFDTEYKNTIIPKLVENKKVLFYILSKRRKRTKENRKIIKRNKEIVKNNLKSLFVQLECIQNNIQNTPGEDALTRLKNNEKVIKDKIFNMVLKDKTLCKRIIDQFNRRKNKPMNSHWCILPSVRTILEKSYIENVFWKKLGPWPIKKRQEECRFEELLVKHEINPDFYSRKIRELKKKISEKNDSVQE